MEGRPTSQIGAPKTERRDRTALAVAEVCAAALLLPSLYLAWFEVAGRDGWPGRSYSWMGYADYGITLTNLVIPLGALAAPAVALVALAWPGRGKVAALSAVFAMAFAGAIAKVAELPGEADYLGSSLSPECGLWLYAAVAAFGAGLALVDLALRGGSTLLSRRLGHLTTRRYAALAVISLVAGIALAQLIPIAWLAVWVVVLGLIPAAPSAVGRVGAILFAWAFVVVAIPMFMPARSDLPGLVFVAALALVLVAQTRRHGLRRRAPLMG
jgi:hypothetical protein